MIISTQARTVVVILRRAASIITRDIKTAHHNGTLASRRLPDRTLTSDHRILTRTLRINHMLITFRFRQLNTTNRPFLVAKLISHQHKRSNQVKVTRRINFLTRSINGNHIILITSPSSHFNNIRGLTLQHHILPLPTT